MLSIRPFSSGEAAGKYYSHGDYYGSEGEGTWFGDGAKDLGLSGNFIAKNNKEFSNLLNGILPNGQILGKKTKEGIEHRPGTDLTFSAPKSFSIQMLLNSSPAERNEMEQALMSAVTKTLDYIEKQGYVFTRKGQGGREIEKLDKLTFATFMHTTNRNLEPQAHVHCFLANVANCKDGKYRSIDNDHLLENNKLFGQIFRNELALEVKKLGHEISPTILSDGSSGFELSKIDPKSIQAFSTRRKEIVELCKQFGVTTKEGRDKIVINSRKAKKLVTQDQLIKAWSEVDNKVRREIEAEQKNSIIMQDKLVKTNLFENIKIQFESLFYKNSNNREEPLTTKDLANLAVEDVSYNKTTFTGEELLKKSLKYGIGSFSVADVNHEIKNLEKNGFLIKHENLLTTKALLDKEKQILKYAADSIGNAKSIIIENKIDHHLKNFKNRALAKNKAFQMNKQQQKAIKHILASQDKIITMEGLPGVGKSTVLNAVRDISCRKVINLLGSPFGFGERFEGSAPTASAAKTLQESAKLESQTLHSFLSKYMGYIEDRGSKGSLQNIRQEYKNAIIFVDEASLISTNMMHKLLKFQRKLGFRLVLTGDTKQLGSVEAGKPFEQMLDIIKPVKLKEIVRQKDESHKQAVIDASDGNINKTFVIHDRNIKTSKSIAVDAARNYLDKTLSQRDNTLLISPTRALRDEINNKICKELNLTGQSMDFTALRQKDITKADYNFAPSFAIGDVIKFNTKYKNGINKGDYLKVKSANSVTNSLILEKNGKEVYFSLSKKTDYSSKMEVFQVKPMQLQEGLKIIFTKNNKELGLINSETAHIEQIHKNNITLKFEDGKSKSIPVDQLKHIDYGYCVTVHNAQGKTFDHTIAAINNNKLLNNQKMWLVALSRHRNEFTAFIEDKDQLRSSLLNNKGAGLSAIELQAAGIKTSNELQITTKNDNIKGMKGLELSGSI